MMYCFYPRFSEIREYISFRLIIPRKLSDLDLGSDYNIVQLKLIDSHPVDSKLYKSDIQAKV